MLRKLSRSLLTTLTGLGFITLSSTNAQVSLGSNATYRYLKGNEATGITQDWIMPDYLDSSWHLGTGPFHYGDGTGGTLLSDMLGNYSTVFMRGHFTVTNASRVEQIQATIDYDDGFIIWINGVEALRKNAPDPATADSFATDQHESGIPESFIINTAALNLTDGANTIAIMGFNISLGSTDFMFGISMDASVSLPRITQKPLFSKPDMFCDSAFYLTITAPDSTMNILYTLDGSNPGISPTAIHAGKSVTLLVDPDSPDSRPLTPGVVVRACLTGLSGYRTSVPASRTYIFTSRVRNQTFPGGGWPNPTRNGQIIDYDMDPKVTTDPRYEDKIDSSLLAIPTISIVTDLKNLFDPDTGIYVNPMGHGDAWERECSVELINPDGSPGFDVNAGLRIRGGWSRNDYFPKHSLRLFFNAVYGDSHLDYPLFEKEGASKFDKIDLRTSQNYGWSNNSSSSHNTFARETFSRDLQGAMGDPYTRSRYYHLYINGMYWGIYETQERSEANFASTYLGGKPEDYDVVKVNTENFSYTIEATDGTLDSWKNLWNLCSKGFTSNSDYFYLEGKDENGKYIGGNILVNIDNLIDYMLVIFYTGNFDAPYSSFNSKCNNFYAIYDKNSKFGGFTFYAHDSEHAMMTDPISPGIGLQEDRVNIRMVSPVFTTFQPQWLHYRLTSNAEYKMRFADRAYKLLQPGGLLSPEKSLERFNHRVSQLESAIIAESARWGDTWVNPPYTKDDTWLPEIAKVQNIFIPQRPAILISQLGTAGLYTKLKPVQVLKGANVIYSDTLSFYNSLVITLKNPSMNGIIYYTTDGTDPRLVGGEISPNAHTSAQNEHFNINTSTLLRCRINFNGTWSVITSINFLKLNENYSNVKVTELMYHPPDVINGTDTIPGSSLEFIEFKNTGDFSVNMAGLALDSAVHCLFPPNSVLGAGRFWVAASKPNSFRDHYGVEASANYSGNFSNSGEYVQLTNPYNLPLISFTYSDRYPWPGEPDGGGYSLVSTEVNPTGDPADPLYWRPSLRIWGSPFADDDSITSVSMVMKEENLVVYPNPTSDMIYIQFDKETEQAETLVELFNVNGTLVISRKLSSNLSLSLRSENLAEGIYFMRISGTSGTHVAKIIYNPYFR